MSTFSQPWADFSLLQNLYANLRSTWLQREVFRVAVGPAWLRLHLVGDERPGLVFSSRPGSNLVFAVNGTWPDSLKKALPVAKGHLLAQQLSGATLLGIGMLPADKVLAVNLSTPDGARLCLLHQLFGSRGNTTLLDNQGKLIWARHQIPHPLLTEWPPAKTWTLGESDPTSETAGRSVDLFQQMEHQFQSRLVLDVLRQHQTAIRKALLGTDRLVSNLTRDLATAEKGDQFRRWAEALAANLHQLQPGQDVAHILDLQDNTPISIPLDPALSPAINMENWFRKARKADKGREVIRENLTRNKQQQARQLAALTELEALAERTPNPENLAALQQWANTHQELLPQPKLRSDKKRNKPVERTRPFRRYLIDEKWEVWVGRNNKENDLLTHRHSHNQDLWFHAQGVAGSHVILRTNGHPEQIPKTVLEKAAALAGLHSKAKHSALVPVIYTEKRFVRKPRKSPPGLAVCLREKSIFVEPKVALGVSPA